MTPYFDLGGHTRPITTSSSEAQIWFDRGLNWCFAFNQEEGVHCFQKALQHDPDCAMAYWGIAYAAGPFYNMPWCDFCPQEITRCTKFCFDNITGARSLVSNVSKVTSVEAGLINALAARFQCAHGVAPEEFDAWDDAYAEAMRQVYQKFPQDLDVAALFVEAMMTRTPWRLWNVKTDQPADGADTLECLAVLDQALAQVKAQDLPQHPAILHLHIHCLEMSPAPQRALESANMLRGMCPEAGHILHMPGHIYVLCGLYAQAKVISEDAIQADRKYLDYAGPYNFYTSSRCHDLHLIIYTCMFMGQFAPAMQATDEMCATLSRDVLAIKGRPYLAMTLEGYYSMKMHVLVRFGKWRQIIDTPLPQCPHLYCVSTAMHYYAKTIAHATLGQIARAERERACFYDSLANIPDERKFFNNRALTILEIAQNMLNGELEYHKGNYADAFQYLRDSVRLDDNLAYSEPWAWMHPPRHALGALLIEQGHYDEAESVYRTDLGLNNELQRCSQHPDNVWALHGLAECLRQRRQKNQPGDHDKNNEWDEITVKLGRAMAKTDIPITSSCCCRKNTRQHH
ncbi:tetratricopeptide repeat protein [Candidatus Spongiihabitans sp.]|uniref:tetratricopeptide repeat protein n=1 Tax=Candidatus Spongiihabitans sp. TaxID=3101308 RepID=UPI003C7DA188